ncbi:MAG: ABC transporter permease subunit [Phycisphaerales bacterium]|nr:ABC transporter permease subunit [Phycisphaerales bacterium]
MKRIWPIAKMTFKEGLRMRVFLVVLLVLGFAVMRLPFALKGDETLAGRLQTFLSYSLGALGLFMGFATVFMACATLTGEIRTKSIHLVLTKPVNRFELLAGKWIGVNLLNILIVLISGAVIYGFAVFIMTRPEKFVRDRINIRDVIWTAREAARPVLPDFRAAATAYVDDQLSKNSNYTQNRDLAIVLREKEMLEQFRLIGPQRIAAFNFENLTPPEREDTAMQVRYKARGVPIPKDEIVVIDWGILDQATGAALFPLQRTEERMTELHQFLLRQSNVAKDGKATLLVGNPTFPDAPNRYVLAFEGDDALELLYKVGSFEVNFAKSLMLILFRLGFLSAIGLFFGTFTSFPVACFCTLSIYLFCIGIPWWMESIGANLPDNQAGAKVDPYGSGGRLVRMVLVPILTFVLPDFFKYDGVDKLIDGYYISWELIASGAAHTIIYGLVLLALPGWLIFRSREIAGVTV